MPTSESQLIAISRRADRAGDIIFVHGLDGDPVGTWTASSPDLPFYFPKYIGQVFQKSAVWSLGFPAASTAWRGHAMPLAIRDKNVLQLFLQNGIGSRPIIFVTHSLGGLLVKQILRTAHTHNNPAWEAIGRAVVGVMFLATPHSGSNAATLVNIFRSVTRANWTIQDLQLHEPHLADLNEWFRANFQRLGLRAHVIREDVKTYGVMVVDPASADPGIPPVKVIPADRNHIDICKPCSISDFVFQETRMFISSCYEAQKIRLRQIKNFVRTSPHKDTLRVYFSSSIHDVALLEGLVKIIGSHPHMMPMIFDFKDSSSVRIEAIQSADLFISVHENSSGLYRIASLEITEAKRYGVPHLLFYPTGTIGSEEESSHDQELSIDHGSVSFFRTAGELLDSFDKYLNQFQSDIHTARERESMPDLVARHLETCNLIDQGNLDEALARNSDLLRQHPFSPRAHFNQACIYSRLAAVANNSGRKDELLRIARVRLADSVKCGWLDVLSRAKDSSIGKDPTQVILQDPDLHELFSAYPEVKGGLESKSAFYIRPHARRGGVGGGCVCGCTSADGVSKFGRGLG